MNLEGRNLVENPAPAHIDRWIYARLNSAAAAISEAFFSYRYNDAALAAYEYFWNDFCDWYVEATKLSLRSEENEEKDRATAVLLDVLAESLRLLHPFLPFVTEEIYGKLPNTEGFLINAPYPEYDEKKNAPEDEKNFAFLQEIIRSIRTLRSECTIPPEKKIKVFIKTNFSDYIGENAALIKLLANIGDLETGNSVGERPKQAIALAGTSFEAFVFIAESADIAYLKQKFSKELEKDRKFIDMVSKKLANENFIKNAPAPLIEEEKRKLEDALTRTKKIESYLNDMEVL
jgi:valyl-tRNA synthetase